MRFIIFCISPNCLTRRFTSAIERPLPVAMRWRRLPLMISGLRRSSLVIDRIMASTGFSSSSPILAFFNSLGIPGIMPINPPSGPIFLSDCICSKKSSSVKSPSSNLAAASSAASFSNACSACSMRVSMSPIPKMRPAIRSGWNCSNASSFSPVLAKAMGRPMTSLTDNAAPPRASPSSFDKMTPSICKVL